MAHNKSYGKAVRSAGKPESRRNAKDKESSPLSFDWGSVMDYGQNALTVAGMTPLFGNVADGLNVAISGGRAAYAKHVGDEAAYKHHRNSAAINAAAAIPGAGLAVGAGKLAKAGITAAKGANTADKLTDATKLVKKGINVKSKAKAALKSMKDPKFYAKTGKGYVEAETAQAGVDIADKVTMRPKTQQITKRKVKDQTNLA